MFGKSHKSIGEYEVQRGYLRQGYLDRLLGYLGNTLIKVLIGQRRCGKSTILKQFIAHLLRTETPPHHILYLNMELHELQFITTDKQLIEVFEWYFQEKSPAGKVYIFLDEVQEIEGWEKAVNSFLAHDRYDIEFFLTGSNAHLLSTELSIYVTGRYVEIAIFPFSFQEYCEYQEISCNKSSLIRYLDDSGLPELFALLERSQKISYLMALKDSILMHDIVKRFHIKHPKLLALLLEFLIDNTARLFSIGAIEKELKLQDISLNFVTLSNYLYYLELTFLIHCVRRYDLKGKKILEGERKYYLNDLSFSNYLQTAFDSHITRRLENYVYLTLTQAGFTVSVGNLYQLEIDFIAQKDKKIIYIQVSYLLHDEAVIAREYGNLERIRDNWPKWVVSLDEVLLPIKEGIYHVQAWDLHRLLKDH